MLIRLQKLHARSLRESKRDSDGVTVTRYQAELQNNEGDLSLILKGIPTDEAAVLANSFIAGQQYDVQVTIKEHQDPQMRLGLEVRGEETAPATDDDLPPQLRRPAGQPSRARARKRS